MTDVLKQHIKPQTFFTGVTLAKVESLFLHVSLILDSGVEKNEFDQGLKSFLDRAYLHFG